MGIFVNTKGKVITDSQGQIYFTNGVGGKVKRVYQPAGKEKTKRNTTRRENQSFRVGASIVVQSGWLRGHRSWGSRSAESFSSVSIGDLWGRPVNN